jgi:hypothetical protein
MLAIFGDWEPFKFLFWCARLEARDSGNHSCTASLDRHTEPNGGRQLMRRDDAYPVSHYRGLLNNGDSLPHNSQFLVICCELLPSIILGTERRMLGLPMRRENRIRNQASGRGRDGWGIPPAPVVFPAHQIPQKIVRKCEQPGLCVSFLRWTCRSAWQQHGQSKSLR